MLVVISTKYSILLKLYKPQPFLKICVAIGKYSILLKLYKPQLGLRDLANGL